MGGLLTALDFLLLTFAVEAPKEACEERREGIKEGGGVALFAPTKVGACGSSCRREERGLMKSMKGQEGGEPIV